MVKQEVSVALPCWLCVLYSLLPAGVCLQDPAPPVSPRLQGCRLEPLLSGLDGEVEDHGGQQEGEAEAGGQELGRVVRCLPRGFLPRLCGGGRH